MGSSSLLLLLCVFLFSFVPITYQLKSSQTQVLLQVRKHLEYPKSLEIWDEYSEEVCYSPPSPQLTISCEDTYVTELKIFGDKSTKVSEFKGLAIPNQTLSKAFSIDSFVVNLSRLTKLRVLILVSTGIWGPLPDKIHRLYSLELLDLSSNFLFGSIPPKISTMERLQTLTLDGNFFDDTVPDWLHSLSNLTLLSLKRNKLKGTFPSSVCRITKLTVLALSHNKISGKLPEMDSLTNLRVLDLRENQFDSELPVLPKGLVTVLLSKNSFSGEISQQFDELVQLQHLDLSFNFLQGTPPAALFSLPSISYLNLASNELSGSLHRHQTCGSELGFVDISSNRLTGALPSCLSSAPNNRVVMFGGNCLSVDPKHQHQKTYCKEVHRKSRQSGSKDIGVLIAVVGVVVIVMILLGYGFLVLCKRYSQPGTSEQLLLSEALPENSASGFSSGIFANASFISEAAKLPTQALPACRLFSLEELKEATNNFDQSAFIGEGSMGKLYKGKLENGTNVAIRCLAFLNRHLIQNLKLRLDLLSKLQHPHLVCLLGHCIDTGGQDDSNVHKVFIVYEYVPRGNFRTHLSDSPEKGLKWSERLAVLIGVAKAVHFLHTGMIPGFFNNQLKTNNILLDEHRIAKLSDYGLSLITEEIENIQAKGEDQKWQITNLQLDDVYSFGFILLEALVGPSIYGRGKAFLLNEMASFGSQDGLRRIVDPIVLTTCSQESLSIVISITNKCISPELMSRPSFEDVLWNLQYAAQVQATTDGEQK